MLMLLGFVFFNMCLQGSDNFKTLLSKIYTISTKRRNKYDNVGAIQPVTFLASYFDNFLNTGHF